MSRLQESLFSQILPTNNIAGQNQSQAPVSDLGQVYGLHNNNTTQGQTFEDTRNHDDDADESREEAQLELAAEKEQLEVAKTLIIKQKEEMMALVMKMREMHAELKHLRLEPTRDFV